MIQLNFLFKRRSDLSDSAFDCACADYLEQVQQTQSALGFQSASLTKCVITPYQECMRSAHRVVPRQFDAVLTLQWTDWTDYADAAGQPEGIRAHDRLAEIESDFFDRSHSQIFISQQVI